VLQYGLQLILEYLVELLPQLSAAIDFGKLLDAMNEELEFFENLAEHLNILVIDWLVKKVVEAKSTSNDQHQALVELAGDIK
jgi:hypothetical protein